MNALWQWLRLPWLATLRGQRIFTLTLQLCLLAGALAAWLLLVAGDGRLQTPLTLLGFATGFWWMFVGGRWLLIMQDAAALRLPRAHRRTGSSLASAVVQTILAPAVLMACLGAPFDSSVLFLASASSMTLLWALLPRFLIPFFGLLPATAIGLSNYLGWPSISDAAFAPQGAELAVLGLLLVTLRMVQLQRAPDREYSRWTIPMALLLRGQQGVFEGLPRGPQRNLRGPAQHTMSQDVDFSTWGKHRAVDPRHDCRLVRTIIGVPFAPRRIHIELRDWGLGIAAVAVLELIGWRLLPLDLLRIFNASILLWTVLMGVFFVPMLASHRLATLFGRQPAATVVLLAHLPGLSDIPHARRILLRATLGDGLRRYAIGVLVLIAAWLLLVGLPQVAPLLLAAALLAAILAGAAMLAALSGQDFEDGSTRALARRATFLAVLMVLAIGSSILLIPLALAPLTHKPPGLTWAGQHPWAIAALALGWSGVLVFALARLVRNWRAFQRRPQPFMHR